MYFKRLLLVIIFGGSVIVFVLYQLWLGTEEVEVQARVFVPRLDNGEKTIINTTEREESPLPERIYLDVPYTVQAPYAKWDVYDEEACEEAALLMAYEYLEGNKYPQGVIPKEEAQRELRKMIDFQVSELAYEVTTDLYPEEIKKFVESYWPGYTIKILEEINFELIKKELAKNNPVVVPATAKVLGNPWYHYPDYHMLVIIGYEGNEFITNDPGTKRGEDWRYPQELVLEALEDSGGEAVTLVKK